jgi:hypothetical protein
LTDNPNLLISAASILTNEARHDTYLRDGIKASPFPSPFDTPLSAMWAYNLALQFVVSCPQYLPGLSKLPVLNLTSPMPAPHLQPLVPVGTTLSFAWDPTKFLTPVAINTPLYIAFINQNASAPVYARVTSTGTGKGTVTLPGNVYGVAFAVLTASSGGLNATQLSSNGTLAGPAEIVLS